jgi:hypothetical protein
MSKKTYAEQINDAGVMATGLQNNADAASKRGLDETFVSKMIDDLEEAIGLNSVQEKLKADLKQKTQELEAKMAALNAAVAQARKIVKIDFPQARWIEFGIGAKQ